VTAVGSGAAARSGAAKTDSPAAAEVLRMVRLETVREGIRHSRHRFLCYCERSEAISTIST
jgi:hypothetical protein